MRLFKRKDSPSGTALADPAPPVEEFAGSTDALFAEITALARQLGERRDPDTERRLLYLRHQAGVRILDEGDKRPRHPNPDHERLPDADGIPEFGPQDLTPSLVRAGILRDGCVLVRGLIDRHEALSFADEIDRAYEERERVDAGGRAADGYYEEFTLDPRFESMDVRWWVREGGGLLAVDSPRLSYEMLDLFERAGLRDLVGAYLGERPMISAHKTTLRKAAPSVPGKWHQDGAFMGDIRSLNLWLSLSRCGDEAPGLDIVPRRLDGLVASEMPDDPALYYLVSDDTAKEAAGEKGIIRPIFEPGDALLFDELFLHQTASDPSMPNHRFAIESWFFGGSAFPPKYAPIAV